MMSSSLAWIGTQNSSLIRLICLCLKLKLSANIDVRLFSEDNKELELKENIEDAIDFNLDEHKKMVSGEKSDVVVDNELSENYVDDEEDETMQDDDYEENDELFENIDDSEDEDFILSDEDLMDDGGFDDVE